MKIVLFAALGFAIGIGIASFVRHNPSFQLQLPTVSIDPAAVSAAVASAAKSLQPTEPRPSATAPTLQLAIAPVYEVLFGSPDDAGAVSVAIEETAELEKLLISAPRNEACDAARRVGSVMKAARLETERGMKSSSQNFSSALGGGHETKDFFGGVYEQRWRANMAVLAKKAVPEWQRFVAVEPSISQPAEFQSAIGTLMNERRQRHLVRTAILVIGTVRQSFDDGAIVSRTVGDNVFIAGLKDVADKEDVQVLVHEAGLFKITNQEGTPMTLRKFRFFRNAPR